jgi:hypothetical protein
MEPIRPNVDGYYKKDNIASIQDYYTLVKNTENYRAQKVIDLRNEHVLIMRRIDRITQQKTAYMRISNSIPKEDTPEGLAPVNYTGDFDTKDSKISLDEKTNKIVLMRKPTDPKLNYTRDTLRKNIAEIEIKIRDYDYQLMRLSLLERKLTYSIKNLLKNETTAQQVAV